MVLWLFHYFRGYLILRFNGVYSEKILTDIAAEKIPVWSLKYQKGTIFGKMFAKDFKRLRKLRKGSGIRIHIVEKRGLPFFLRRHKNRAGLIVGAVLFFLILEYLSSYIWIINVNGNKAAKTADILASLSRIGIHERMPVTGINSKISAQKLLVARNDLAWASLNVEGSVLNVNVTEIKNSPASALKPPSNLIAAEDGIIRKIDAVSGDVRIKAGDNVHKGDVLISGVIENMSSTVFVRSRGRILAQVERVYKKRADFMQKHGVENGKTDVKSVFEILGVKIPLFLGKRTQKANVSYRCEQLLIMGNRVPVKYYVANYRYFDTRKFFFSEAELKSKLSNELKDFIDKKTVDGYIPLATGYKSDKYGVTVIHRYLRDVNIAKETEILISQKIDKKR